jgi:hypothetical protein
MILNSNIMFINLKPFDRDFSKFPLSETEQKEIFSALESSYNFIKEIQEYLPEEKFGKK